MLNKTKDWGCEVNKYIESKSNFNEVPKSRLLPGLSDSEFSKSFEVYFLNYLIFEQLSRTYFPNRLYRRKDQDNLKDLLMTLANETVREYYISIIRVFKRPLRPLLKVFFNFTKEESNMTFINEIGSFEVKNERCQDSGYSFFQKNSLIWVLWQVWTFRTKPLPAVEKAKLLVELRIICVFYCNDFCEFSRFERGFQF